MDKIEKVKRYIKRTAIPWKLSSRYDCTWSELEAVLYESRHPLEAVCLAYSYGKAKGYRAGKEGSRRYE